MALDSLELHCQRERLSCRKAREEDLEQIIHLLHDDSLGKQRETLKSEGFSQYKKAFSQIDQDSKQYIMVVEKGHQIVATCHLTLMPSLTFGGKSRLNIEAVRVDSSMRGMGIGEWMFEKALAYGREKGVHLIQLCMNKDRKDSGRFYRKLGFQPTHEGYKLYLSP